jgi:hypothetical protein
MSDFSTHNSHVNLGHIRLPWHVSLHHFDKIPDENNLKGGVVYFSSSFKRFSPWSFDCAFWVCGKAEHHGGRSE